MNTQIKARHEFKQGNLEVKFGQSKFFKTSAMNGKTDVDFFYATSKFFCLISSLYQKVTAVLLNHLRVRVSKVSYRLDWKSGEATTMKTS
jgi:hypothetical protein